MPRLIIYAAALAMEVLFSLAWQRVAGYWWLFAAFVFAFAVFMWACLEEGSRR